MNIDSSHLECPDEVPSLPDQERLLLHLSEKTSTHGVSVRDAMELPHSPNFSPPQPSVIEALRCVCV